MLRESMKTDGKSVDLRGVTAGFGTGEADPVELREAEALEAFAEAVVRREHDSIGALRQHLIDRLGAPAFVDAAATVAAFHGFVRVADGIGIPYRTAVRGEDAPELRTEAGIDRFFRIAQATG